jgi:hypothetical protein
MIKGIYSGGKYVSVQGGSPAWPSIYNTYGGTGNGPQGFAGQVRYSTTSQAMEVFDGSTWQAIGNNISQVGLTPEAEALLDWAREKRQEEVNLKMRMEQHPGLKDAWEKFQIMNALTLEEEKIHESR